MAGMSKRRKALVDAKPQAPLEIKAALQMVKETATAKFDETVEMAINLGIDPRKSDQVVRGAVVLPHGTGKQARVAVFAFGKGTAST